MSRFVRYAHQLHTPPVKEGDYVKRGDVIGFVGSTGTSTGNHLHCEIRLSKYPSWHFYPVQWTKNAVKAVYVDPSKYAKGNIPVNPTKFGYHYLEYAAPQKTWHCGVDFDAPAGTPIRSLFNGRVVRVEGESLVKNTLGKLIPTAFNAGWGNFVIIETNEADPGIIG